MERKPFFSIVIPVLNEEKYLPELLKDLSNQSINDFEVIIVDGHSTDRTVPRCLEYKDKLPSLKIITSDIRNVSVQRNAGAEASQGTYVVFNDADNNLPKFFLEGLRYQLHKDPVDLFTTWCLPDTDRSADKAVATYLNLMIEVYDMSANPGALGAMIGCLKSKFHIIGGFDKTVGFAEDTEFVRQGYAKGLSFRVFREPRYVYSLRRFRKLGILKMIHKTATLYIKYITRQQIDQKREYPMGGEIFGKDAKTRVIIDKIDAPLKKLSRKPKLMDRIKALISLEESN